MPHQHASNEYPLCIFPWSNNKNVIRIPLLSGTMSDLYMYGINPGPSDPGIALLLQIV